MPGRQFNGNEYRYGFNKGSEKDDEISGNGNNLSTFYRELDTRICRWWGLDPKINAGESPYVSMSNNPIMFNDALGDSIRKTTSFMKDNELMKAFDTWAATRQGKKFLKDYGVGGKHENIAVVFDNGPLTYVDKDGKIQKQDAQGVTGTEYVNETGKATSLEKYSGLGVNSIPENIKNAITNKSKSGDYIRFTIKFPGAMNKPARAAYNILHESQHLRVIHSDVVHYMTIRTSREQHDFMDSRAGYINESVDFLFQIRDTWIKDFNEQRHNKFGDPTMEKYVWNLMGFWH